MRVATHMLDRGVRDVVELLNSIDGVTTRASCEGQGDAQGHRHSDLAYIAFEFPIPIRLQSFLIAELEMVARVDDDAVYCRWPHENRQFLLRLSDAARRYKRRERRQRRETAQCLLAKLRARLAAMAADGQDVTVSLCLGCEAIVLSPHDCDATMWVLMRWPADLQTSWFAEFLEQPGNGLDASLLTALGIAEIEGRGRRGDFGAQFRKRWLYYRAERAHLQMTNGLRAGVQRMRNEGTDIDVCFETGRVRLSWRRPRGAMQ